MSNSLDPDQARRFVGPDRDPNCLQRLLANEELKHFYLLLLSYSPDQYIRTGHNTCIFLIKAVAWS